MSCKKKIDGEPAVATRRSTRLTRGSAKPIVDLSKHELSEHEEEKEKEEAKKKVSTTNMRKGIVKKKKKKKNIYSLCFDDEVDPCVIVSDESDLISDESEEDWYPDYEEEPPKHKVSRKEPPKAATKRKLQISDKQNALLKQLVVFKDVTRQMKTNSLEAKVFKFKFTNTENYVCILKDAAMYPKLFQDLVESIKEVILKEKQIDVGESSVAGKSPQVAIVGVPYGATHIASAVAYSCKLAYFPTRKENDNGYRLDSDTFSNFEYILIEDTMTTGNSIIGTLKNMAGKKVTDVITIVDDERGGKSKILKEYPQIRLHSILKRSELEQFLCDLPPREPVDNW